MQTKKLYLDVCTICRPLDDQSIMRIRLETDAFYMILQSIKNGNYKMMVSPVHLKEIDDIDDIHEKTELVTLLNKFGTNSSCNLPVFKKRAEYFISLKFGIADATHLAFAEATSDVFITCDDKLLIKCNKININILAVSPIEFCIMEDLK